MPKRRQNCASVESKASKLRVKDCVKGDKACPEKSFHSQVWRTPWAINSCPTQPVGRLGGNGSRRANAVLIQFFFF